MTPCWSWMTVAPPDNLPSLKLFWVDKMCNYSNTLKNICHCTHLLPLHSNNPRGANHSAVSKQAHSAMQSLHSASDSYPHDHVRSTHTAVIGTVPGTGTVPEDEWQWTSWHMQRNHNPFCTLALHAHDSNLSEQEQSDHRRTEGYNYILSWAELTQTCPFTLVEACILHCNSCLIRIIGPVYCFQVHILCLFCWTPLPMTPIYGISLHTPLGALPSILNHASAHSAPII